jgi:BT1 family
MKVSPTPTHLTTHPTQATAGSLQSLCWASSALGGVASAYWSGSLVGSIGARGVFGITALFPLVVSASAMLIDEQRVVLTPGGSSGRGGGRQRRQNSGVSGLAATGSALAAALATQGAALWGAIRQRHILLPTVFVFLWQVCVASWRQVSARVL